MAVTFPKNERIKKQLEGNHRLLIYSQPGVGKTFFAGKFPDPLLLSTDGNWRFTDLPYLEVTKWKASKKDLVELKSSDKEIAAKAQAEVNSSFENIVDGLVAGGGGDFKTIIVDLVEDVYRMAVENTLRERSISALGELPFGQGYIETRNTFYKVYKKLISLPVNVILLSHEKTEVVKDRLGRESSYFRPKLDDATLDLLSGSGFTLRAAWESSLNEKNVKTMRRTLSMGSTPDWFGVTRFTLPIETTETIDLDFDAFEAYVKYHNQESQIKPVGAKEVPIALKKQNVTIPETKPKKKAEPVVEKEVEEVKKVDPVVTTPPVTTPPVKEELVDTSKEVDADAPVISEARNKKIDEIMKRFNKHATK